MRRRALLVFLAVVIAVLGLARAHVAQTSTAAAEPARAVAVAVERSRPVRAGEETRAGEGAATSTARAVHDAAQRRVAAVAQASASAADPPRAAPHRTYADHDASAAAPERTLGLRDRIGGRETMMAALRTEFEPLAAECLDQASERAPALKGMLAIEFEVVPDAEQGSIVETVEAAASNEVVEPELVECIRQTMLSASLPAVDEREELMITINVGEP